MTGVLTVIQQYGSNIIWYTILFFKTVKSTLSINYSLCVLKYPAFKWVLSKHVHCLWQLKPKCSWPLLWLVVCVSSALVKSSLKSDPWQLPAGGHFFSAERAVVQVGLDALLPLPAVAEPHTHYLFLQVQPFRHANNLLWGRLALLHKISLQGLLRPHAVQRRIRYLLNVLTCTNHTRWKAFSVLCLPDGRPPLPLSFVHAHLLIKQCCTGRTGQINIHYGLRLRRPCTVIH